MVKLTKLSKFVLDKCNLVERGSTEQFKDIILSLLENYTMFLNQKMNERYYVNGVMAHPLNRFVACDLNGSMLKEPVSSNYGRSGESMYKKDLLEYKEANNRIIFKDCSLIKNVSGTWIRNSTLLIDLSYEESDSSFQTYCGKFKELSTIEDLIEFSNLELTKIGELQYS